MTDAKTEWIIEVTATVDPDDMDSNDIVNTGDCIVDGAYRVSLEGALLERDDPAEAAHDVFHATVPISALDDYDIITRPATQLDGGDGWLRRELGTFSEVPAPAIAEFGP